MKLSHARQQATLVATLIVSARIDAYDGAMKIWKEILDDLDERIPDDLWPFKSNASAIEDCLWDAQDSGANHDAAIVQYRTAIVEAANLLLGVAGPTHSSER